MSNRRNTRRRETREKKQFVDEEEDEEDQEIRNKIESKQENQFGSHKLQQNFFQQSQLFIDVSQSSTAEAPVEPKPSPLLEDIVQEEQAESIRKSNKRPPRDKKQFTQQDREEERHSNHPQFNSKPKNEESSSGEEDVMQKMRQMAMKKSQSKKVSEKSSQIMIHALLNKAGTDRQARKNLIYSPLSQGEHSFVYFKRHSSGFSEYYQVLGEDQRPIFFCENQRGCIGCNYYISMTKEMDKNSPAFLGKLRGNAAGSTYLLYDNGLQPNSNYDREKLRATMAHIEYESTFMGMGGPRKFKVTCPKPPQPHDLVNYRFREDENMTECQLPKWVFRNKTPRWNKRLKSYALNFGGRVKQPSIKNFILTEDSYEVEQQDTSPNTILFGKIDENTFALEYRCPLSVYQAFGVAMSEFDFKLKCE